MLFFPSSILVSFFSEDNVLSDQIKKSYIFQYQSNENWAFHFFWDTRYRAILEDLLYTLYISRGFYFRKFRESGASREFNNTQKYLPLIPTHECDLYTQY